MRHGEIKSVFLIRLRNRVNEQVESTVSMIIHEFHKILFTQKMLLVILLLILIQFLTYEPKHISISDLDEWYYKQYMDYLEGEVTEEKLQALKKGVMDEGEKLKPARVILLKSSGRESRLEVELKEGKNREIRRLFLALGHEVTMLKRIAYGDLKLEKLSSGEFRKLSDDEVRACLWAKAPKK